MKKDRLLKAQSICKKLIQEYFCEYIKEESITHGIITVTHVAISSELSYLDIYVSCLKNESTLTKSLSKYAENIERLLARKIDFIKIPKVRFKYDETGKNSFEIYQKISSLDT